MGQLEALLANVANAKLNKEDLAKFGDKNLIKLFKTGQLSIEYLLFMQQYSEAQLAHAQSQHRAAADKASALEKEVLRDRQTVLNLRADCKLKWESLNAYEQMLKKPLGKATVFKCQICFKYFQDGAYLEQHYQRRHREFYESERFRKQSALNQNQLETKDLVAQAAQERADFLTTCKAELVDQYSLNFVELQAQLQALSQENAATMAQHANGQAQVAETVAECQKRLAEYQTAVSQFKQQTAAQIGSQNAALKKAVEDAVAAFAQKSREEQESEARQRRELEARQKEQEFKLVEEAKRQTQERLAKDFEKQVKFHQERVAERDQQLLIAQQKLRESQ